MDDLGPRIQHFKIRSTLFAGIFATILGPLFLVVYLTMGGNQHGYEKPREPMYLGAGIVLTLVGIGYLTRGLRSVSVHERGLLIAKVFGARAVPWTEVTKVSVGKRTAGAVERAVSTAALLAPNKVSISVVGPSGPLVDLDSHHVAKNLLREMGEAIVQHGGLVPTRTADPNVFGGDRA